MKNILFTSFFFLILSTNVFADNILIFGGTKNTGLEAARILKEQGHQVVAFVRNSSDTTDLDSFGILTVSGDAMDIDTVKSAFNYESFDSVFSLLSGGRSSPEVDSQGNINVFKEESIGLYPEIIRFFLFLHFWLKSVNDLPDILSVS